MAHRNAVTVDHGSSKAALGWVRDNPKESNARQLDHTGRWGRSALKHRVSAQELPDGFAIETTNRFYSNR